MDTNPVITITKAQSVTSYSWEDEETPTITVPGRAAKRTGGPKSPPILLPDTEPRFLDLNAGKFPRSPMEPGIRAVLSQQPDFPFHELDIITDRYALSSLLKLVAHKLNYDTLSRANAFSFGAMVLGKTVVSVDDTKEELQVIHNFRNFRVDFGKQFLQYDNSGDKDPLAHYRIITHRLGGLHIMLRHKTDGYHASSTCSNREGEGGPGTNRADQCLFFSARSWLRRLKIRAYICSRRKTNSCYRKQS